ncbi:polysaccharide pyruvyl transferase family protein [Candidatus Absconditicoccus praedator]|uniref:polysaccharide pyruvyl transferase family protein n=1 Tax=Candidatus Absconditicoccus praedator TaxID=2735562 RepID=UPI001E3E45A9|nr:polysaccharide pyruvyl transferase family protein [Candidatus Absconditicoccus praedator]UFX82874.1 polysaccharide pyruvyl transferase family protein [Candidatus Absconditicoccus praedator]
MKAVLMGYYGYKNFGDELILISLLNYLQKNYRIHSFWIQTPDPEWLEHWLNTNTKFLDVDTQKIDFFRNSKKFVFDTDVMYFWGGGEVLSGQRSFPFDGWKYPIKHLWSVLTGNFVLLGGVGSDDCLRTKLLYKLILPKASDIILRDQDSLMLSKKYNTESTLYHDFALDVFDRCEEGKVESKNLLVNMNPYVYHKDDFQKIFKIIKEFDGPKYFFPADIGEDTRYWSFLKQRDQDLQLFDRTCKNIQEIYEFFQKADSGVGARVHFLLLLKYLGKDIYPIAYQEKVNKLI